MKERRFVEWAGIGWPKAWAVQFPRKDGGEGVLWPIVDTWTSGPIDGYPTPEQWFATAQTPEAQRAVCDALNAAVGAEVPRPEAGTPEWRPASADDATRGVAWIDWDATHIGKIGVRGQRHVLKLPDMNGGKSK